MEKVTALMDDLPQLYQVWVFNSIYHSDKVGELEKSFHSHLYFKKKLNNLYTCILRRDQRP